MNRLSLLSLSVPIGLLLVPACSSKTTETPATDTGNDAGAGGEDSGSTVTQCTAAREQFLVPIGKVSTGQVVVVKEEAGVTTLYVDASANGFDQAIKNPRVYVSLTGARVDVTDKTAVESTEWDLAMKRQVIFTNGGDAGPGSGGGGLVQKAFDEVTAADADAATIAKEEFLDDECQKQVDQIGDPLTTFTGWYDYDEASMRASPKKNVTFIVKGGTGTRYKVGIESYTGKPDGTTTAPSTGFYLLRVAPL